MTKIKALIVDDVIKVAHSLRQLIHEFCDDVEVLAMANSADEAKTLIERYKPDIIFLDINMPEKSGFDLLESMDKIDFSIIFVTAYNEYAIRAIKFGAIDYLLKPVDITELQEAIGRAKEKSLEKKYEINALLNNLQNPDDQSNSIIINSEKGYTLIKIHDIIRIEADGNYSMIFTENGKRHVSSKNLKSFNSFLEKYNFIRIHHSHLINSKKIQDLNTKEVLEIKMNNGDVLPISTRKKQEVIKAFERF